MISPNEPTLERIKTTKAGPLDPTDDTHPRESAIRLPLATANAPKLMSMLIV